MKPRSLKHFAAACALVSLPLWAHAQATITTSSVETATWQDAVVSADSHDDGRQTDGEAAQVLNALPFFRMSEVGLTRAGSVMGGAMSEGHLGGSSGNTSGVGAGSSDEDRRASVVPEPENWLLLTLGVPLLLARRKRSSKQ